MPRNDSPTVTLTVRNTPKQLPSGVLRGSRHTWPLHAITKVEDDGKGGAKVWVKGGFDEYVPVEESEEQIRTLIDGDAL